MASPTTDEFVPPTEFTPQELEFLAEDTMITIIPNFKQAVLPFLRRDYGPFTPPQPVEVPLWLALNLKKRQKCKIKPPEWLDVEFLSAKLEAERQQDKLFEKMDFHFVEVATLLLTSAYDDIRNSIKVRELLKDIQEVRMAKLRRGLLSLNGSTSAVKLNNICAMEIYLIRPLLLGALDRFHLLSPRDEGLSQSRTPTPVRPSGASSTPTSASGAGSRTQSEPRVLRRSTVVPPNVLRERNLNTPPVTPQSGKPVTRVQPQSGSLTPQG